MITTESVADVPRDLVEKYGIAVLPHRVSIENGNFRDTVDIESDGLIAYMADKSKRAWTGAPTVEEHEQFFAENLVYANNIVHISVSSYVENSGYPTAVEASKAFDNVTVFDSRHLSSGQGLLVLEACKMAQSGMIAEDIVKELEKMVSRVRTTFIVEDLEYLQRAGQISKRTSKLTRAFMMHPVIGMRKGRMKVVDICFGNIDRARKTYVKRTFTLSKNIDKRLAFITYVGLNQDELGAIEKEVRKHVDFDKIIYKKTTPAIAINSGPGTFGVLFMVNE